VLTLQFLLILKSLGKIHKCNMKYSLKCILYTLNISIVVVDGASQIGVE
jgi:hypothetical protein